MSDPRLSWPRPPFAVAHPETLLTEATHRRLAFASARTREIWETRLESLSVAAVATELHLVTTGALDVSLVWCPYDGLAAFVEQLKASHLQWKAGQPVLRAIERPDPGAAAPDLLTQISYPLMVSLPGSNTGSVSIDANDPTDTARMFGYPACCATAWAGKLAAGTADPLASLLVESNWAGKPLTTGVMLGTLGLGPVRHLPCNPDCAPSGDMARIFLEAMKSIGFTAEAGWLAQMVEWRARASLVGGIAEVQTGAFRFTWQSGDASTAASSVTSGNGTPEAAPSGLSSIFAKPSVPDRKRAAPEAAESAPDGEDFARAGFSSTFAHRSRWSTVVWEQSKLLRKARTILHPACGGGLLLELLQQSHPSLRVCGIEADTTLAACARARLREDRSMIVEADWMLELERRDAEQASFDLAFVDPEPLLDLSGDRRGAIVAGLAKLARSTVFIATDRALGRFGTLEAMVSTLGGAPVAGRARYISCLLAGPEPAVMIA
jgi:hypothetical protein